jgi:type I restriction-modification system DNA methylase subunit
LADHVMSELEAAYHRRWKNLVEPIEGLVVSVPVLVDAECKHRHGPELREALRDECDADGEGFRIRDLSGFLQRILGHDPAAFDAAPEGASVYLPEGRETVRPTLALKSRGGPAPYVLFVWDLPGIDLDKADTREGAWAYPPKDKFDRLLRHAGVPIGLLTNGRELRLFYAPRDESTGIVTFRVADMADTGGGEILDAFVMLLSSTRFFAVAKDRQLPTLLAESRKRQANVTSALADQVKEALELLVRGFDAAAARDGDSLLREAVESGTAYPALLTVLLRLVFLLYAEDLSLMPVDHPHYAEHLSLLSLHARLQADVASFPDTMPRRFGAWPRVLALFRAVHYGLRQGDLSTPPRHGSLFDPAEHPFLEGWGPAGGAPTEEADRAAVRVPTIDDGTVFEVLDRLLLLEGERLSYRALDVEQIGSVYEALMGYAVVRTDGVSVCTRPHGVWVSASELLALPPKERARFLEKEAECAKREVAKIVQALAASTTEEAALDAIAPLRLARTLAAHSGQLVLQPGPERRRTSSHYTPRTLSDPIVRRTLEPLLATMGESPPSERILSLKICDPAMGSGAFLVGACRFLGAELERAWVREGRAADIAREHGNVPLFAKRLVAQRCLYGVDKNPLAVGLAKLSLWLETLAKDEPFTFLDHALKHGDSLVGLSLDQVRAFHWAPEEQVELAKREIDLALSDGVRARQEILELAKGEDALHEYADEKQRLLFEADDALSRVRLLGDLVVGAFFAHEKPKDREAERVRRRDKAVAWLRDGGAPPEELRAMQRDVRAKVPTFHWMTEFPEVFHAERADPLDGGRVNRVAMMDAFVGNPPFAGKNSITESSGKRTIDWFMATRPEVAGKPNTDLCAYFFRRAADLLGDHGAIGFVATNTIAQGDTRSMGLKALVDAGAVIYEARSSMAWPGDASVSVAVVHLALGSVAKATGAHRLDREVVEAIDSRLSPHRERTDPRRLAANAGIAFMGGKLVGVGLAVSVEEYADLVRKEERNAEVLRPYLGGEELNSNPGGAFDRYMIDFTPYTLDEARKWPDLLRIVEDKVRPARERDKRGTYKTYWWRPGESGGALRAALNGHARCLVSANVTKHLMFSFQSADYFFSQTLYAFALDDFARFAVLQSRVHEPWARLLSSSMRTDLRYSASECFDTFPFPDPLPASLERAGQAFYEARAAYMTKHRRGLTETYNRMKEASEDDAEIVALRRLSEAMDREVLGAYGWGDLVVPAFEAAEGDAGRGRFEEEVVDRLFALNGERAERERVLGAAAATSGERKKGRVRMPRTKKEGGSGMLPGI